MARTKRVVKAVDVIWTIPDSLWPALEAILLEQTTITDADQIAKFAIDQHR